MAFANLYEPYRDVKIIPSFNFHFEFVGKEGEEIHKFEYLQNENNF